MKLMFTASKIDQLTAGSDLPLKTVQDCVTQLQCNPPTVGCCLGEFELCEKEEELRLRIETLYDETCMDEIAFKRWTHTDRSNLETVVKKIDDFLSEFFQCIKLYQHHAFITRAQSTFYSDTKQDMKEGEVLVVCDFAENYSFVVQDEIQSFYWNNEMATVHPFVAYFKTGTIINHVNFVVISECNTHDTVAVHLYIKLFLKFLKNLLPLTKKIIYFSGGFAGQYKNCKNFINLCHHKKDFGIEAEWNFFATSHGKGPCDGVGGTVKRLAAKASLQRCAEHKLDEQILTPTAFYDFCKKNIVNIEFVYATNEDYEGEYQLLQERHNTALTIVGTQRLHHFQPMSTSTLKVKRFSSSDTFQIKKVCNSGQILQDEHINGYVTVVYDNAWWLGYVIEKNTEEKTVSVNFLTPRGPSPSLKYPERQDILNVPYCDILSTVSATTTTGRTYIVEVAEQKNATNALQKKI